MRKILQHMSPRVLQRSFAVFRLSCSKSVKSILVLIFLVTAINNVHGQLVINELLSKIGSADPNQDLTSNSSQDEFIEIINTDVNPLIISGWTINVGAGAPGTIRHTFPNPTTIPAGGSIVVFGGGTPSTTGVFGGALIQTASTGGLSLTDAGTTIRIYNGMAVNTSYAYGASTTGVSLTRNPDISAGALSDHPVLNLKTYSPGFKVTGDPFVTNVKYPGTSTSVSEGIGTVSIPVSIINPDNIAPTQFNLVLVSGTGGIEDLGNLNTWAGLAGGGQTSTNVDIQITDDLDADPGETFVFEIQAVTGGKSAARVSPQQFTLTITDNDVPTFSFNSTSASVLEDGASIEIPVNITNPFGNTSVDVVFFSGSPATATAADVEGFATHTVHFNNAGVSDDQATITITNDAIPEEDEIITLHLQNPQGGSGLGSNINFSLTIQRNDIPLLVINEVHGDLAPGSLGDTNGDATRSTVNDEFIELANGEATPIDISQWKIRTGSPDALQHIFYSNTIIPPGGSIVIFGGPFIGGDATYHPYNYGGSLAQGADDNGDTGGGATGLSLLDAGTTVKILTNNDVLITSLTYTDPNDEAGRSVGRDPDVTGPLSIIPNHPTQNGKQYSPGFKTNGSPFVTNLKFSSASANVGEASTNYGISFTVLNPSQSVATEFDLILFSGNNADLGGYSPRHIQIPAGQTSWIENIDITNDTDLDPNEIFTFNIQNLSGGNSAALVLPSTFALTILDDEFTSVSFAFPSFTISEDQGTFDIPVAITLPAGVETTVEVHLKTTGTGTADDVNNFSSTTLHFGPNSSSNEVAQLQITNDLSMEDDETLIFEIVNPGGGVNTALGSITTFTLTIQKNDSPPLVINEVLAAPGGEDANDDGITDAATDEFIELINTLDIDLDISGWKVGNAGNQFTFGLGMALAPGEAILVFGGYSGTPPQYIHGSFAFISSGLNLSDAGDVITVWDENDAVVSTFNYTAAIPGQSFTRIPDLSVNSSNHPNFNDHFISPGQKINGAVFTTLLKFSVESASVTESAGTYILHVTLLNPTGAVANTAFEVALTSGAPEEIGDFTTPAFDIAPGQVDIEVPITITDNGAINADKQYVFAFQSVSGGMSTAVVLPDQFTLTVTDDDSPTASFVSSSALVQEDAGVVNIDVSLSNPSLSEETTVDVELFSGDAGNITGFSPTTLHFPAGSATSSIPLQVTILDDNLIEDNESLVFRLVNPMTGPSPSLIGVNQNFTLTIQKNDIPSVIINEVLASITNEDANNDGVANSATDEMVEIVNNGLVDLDLSGWKVGDASVRFTFPASTTLKPGEAFVIFGGYNGTAPTFINGSRMFVGSDPSGLGLDDTGDDINVWNENDVMVVTHNFGSSTTDHSSTRTPDLSGLFANDTDPDLNGHFVSPGIKQDGSVFTTQVKFTVASASVTESAVEYQLHVTLLNPTGAGLNTTFEVVRTNGNAAEIGGYTTQAFDIAAGQTDIMIPITIVDNDVVNADRQYTFEIQNVSDGSSATVVSPSEFVLTVTDDEIARVSFVSASSSVSENVGTFDFEVSIEHPSIDHETTVEVHLISGDATDINNYGTTVIHFPAGSVTNQMVHLTLINDLFIENDESLIFQLQNPSTNGVAAALGSNAVFTLTINENDIPPLVINEILASPVTDVNGDGGINPATDEMIELVNNGVVDLDVSGWKVGDGTPRFIFPGATVLKAGEAVVIIGGYNGVAPNRINGSRVFVGSDPNGFDLNNAGDNVNVWTDNNIVVATHTFGTSTSDHSFTRSPDILGNFGGHQNLNGNFYSPGLKQDGTVFTTQVRFSSQQAVVTESSGNYQLHVTVLNPTGASANTTFEVALTSGNASELGNFTLQAKDIPAGQSDVVIPITITNDNVANTDKQYTFLIQSIGGGVSPSIVSPSQFTLTVTNDDFTTVSFVSSSATVSENSGTFNLTVSITNPSPIAETTVEVQLAGDAADLNSYGTTVLHFPAGSSANQSITLTITNDAIIETDEQFVFTLANIAGGANPSVGAQDEFVLTIGQNDTPTIVINEVLAWPSGTTPAPPVTVDANGDQSLNGFTDEMVELVNNGSDEMDISGWKVGDATQRFTFPAQTILRPGEAVVVFGGYTGGPAPALINGVRMFAGSNASGLGLLNTGDIVNVWNSQDVIVATINNYGSATGGKSFTRSPELNGNFVLHSDLNGKFISPGLKADGTVFTTQVKFKVDHASVTESAGTYDLHVSLLNPTNAIANTTVDVALTAGNATELGNYTIQALNIPPGLTDVVVPISITDNLNINPDKQYTFTLQNAGGGISPTILSPSEFILTVTDDDITRVSFVSTSATVAEDAGTFDLALSIALPSASVETTVEVQLTGGDAADVSNFATTVVHFPAGSATNQTLTLTITNDALIENDEPLIFTLANATGGVSASIGNNNTFTLTIEKSDIPSLIINEILAWPYGAGATDESNPAVTVDANDDGEFHAFHDEMIELVNRGQTDLDVSGWKVGDASARFIFPANTIIKAGEAVVIFGGYRSGEIPPDRINGSRMFVGSDASGLGLVNGSDVAHVWNANDEIIATQSYGASESAHSFTLPPDFENDFAVHPALNGAFISPGQKSDGTYFITLVAFGEASTEPVLESDGTHEIKIVLLTPTDAVSNTSFDVVLVGGTGSAQHIGNYTTQNFNVAPEQGVVELEVPITITDDDEKTGPRTFVFEIQNLQGGVFAQVHPPNSFTLTISDDDISTVSFEIESASVVESSGTYAIAINIIAPSSDEDSSIEVALTDGTSADINGFTAQTVVFPAGSAESQEILITITDDTTPEDAETFTFQLQNGDNTVIGEKNQFELTILANDPSLVVNEVHGNPSAITPPTVGHGDANNDGTRSSTSDEFIEFVNNADVSLDVSDWIVRTGSAQLIRHRFPSNTIIPVHGALVLFGGPTPTGKFGGSITQFCNATDVINESAAVSSTNGLILNGGTTIKVENSDLIEVVSYQTPELGTNTASFTRNPDVTGPLVLSNTHPLFGNSYFSPGRKIDGSPFITTIEFAEASKVAGEDNGTSNVTFLFNRPPNEPLSLAFDLVLVSGDAADLNNFTTIHVEVPNGATDASVPITITDDNLLDPSEEFVFEIQNITGGFYPALLTPTLTLTIDDNDVTRVSFVHSSFTASEAQGAYALEVAISNPSTSDETSADVLLVTGDPADLNNFQTVHVTFPPGSSETQTVIVNVTEDNTSEVTENFTFEIDNVEGGILATAGINNTFDLSIIDNDHLVVINEFCAFPSASGAGIDANGDGRINGNEDEFVEIVNTSGAVLDVTGWRLVTVSSGSATTRFPFPPLQLKAGEAIVVFGAWSTTSKGSAITRIGKSRVFFNTEGPAPNTGLGLSNTGATFEIRNSSNGTEAAVTYGATEAVNSISRVLSPDVTGAAYVAHPLLDGKTISPGVKTNGSPFIITTEVQFTSSTGGLYENDKTNFKVGVEISLPDPTKSTTLDITLSSPNPDNEISFTPSTLVFEAGSSETQYISITINDDELLEGDEVFNLDIANVAGGNLASAGVNSRFGFRIYDNDMPIIFNEVHAAPATDITGDANNDATRDPNDDEFVELVNVTTSEIDMSGWKLLTTTLRHTFLAGTKLAPGKAIVVFGGGIPVGFFGGSEFQIASEGGLGLTDNGATITLNDNKDILRSAFSYGPEGNAKQSLTRSPDITGYYIAHAQAPGSNQTLFSPGSFLNGMPFGDVTTDLEPEVLTKTAVYPNPAVSELTVSVPDQSLTYDFVISDVHGREIHAKRKQNGNIAIDVRSLPNGVFVYRIVSTEGKMISTGKLWLQK